MTNKFIDALKDDENRTLTLNGAPTNKSTLDAVLDFFAAGAALRSRSEKEITDLFEKAIRQDANLAMKALFYTRDVRGGQGERRTFRTIIKWLARNKEFEYCLADTMQYIPEYGRWDDIVELFGKTYNHDDIIRQKADVNGRSWSSEFSEKIDAQLKLRGLKTRTSNPVGRSCLDEAKITAINLIKKQLMQDMDAERPSLCAKWIPKINVSSKKTRSQALEIQKMLGVTPEMYRKMLVQIRNRIHLTETDMSFKKWDEINYERVPSRASAIYSKAFRRHDENRYGEYIEAVKSGEKKINAATLYPYDIIRMVASGYRPEMDALWNALPNYVDEPENALVVCDTSGSMCGASENNVYPIHVSVGLAIYFAERNNGPWKDHFITFSASPRMQKVEGDNIGEKYENLRRTEWDQNTNLMKVFRLILDRAVKADLSDDEMVKKLYIISDMEFDSSDIEGHDETNFESIKKLYKKHGYTMPKLVFWNVDAKQTQYPVTANDLGVLLVSGASPSILKYAVNSKALSAIDLMLDVLNSERYEKIKV